jgi:GT2 family glycosyltransferase
MELIKAFRHHLAQEELDQASLVLEEMERLHYPESILRTIEIELDKAKAKHQPADQLPWDASRGGGPFITPSNYLMHRPDLQVAGFTIEQAQQHLIEHGIRELEAEATRPKPYIRRYLDLNDTPSQAAWLLTCYTDKLSHPKPLSHSQPFTIPTKYLKLNQLKLTLPGSQQIVSVQEFAAWAMIRLGVRHFLLVDHTDQLHNGWQETFSEALQESPNSILFCEEYVNYGESEPTASHRRNRQYKSKPSPFRLLTRGYLSGIVAVPTQLLAAAKLRDSYSSTWCLQVDIAQQFPECIEAINIPLMTRYQSSNPSILEYGTNYARSLFSPRCQEFYDISTQNITRAASPDNPLAIELVQGMSGEIIPRLSDDSPNIKVSVIIPFRDQADLLKVCTDSLLRHERICEIELVLADNGSIEEKTKQVVDSLLNNPTINAKQVIINEPFNFSRINNIAASQATGDYILLLNNDIEFKSDNPITSMLGNFYFDHIGAVGVRLAYEDGSIQHQGIVLTPHEPYDTYSPFKSTLESQYDYSLAALICTDQWSAATAACLLIDRRTWEEIGGLDEDLVVAYNDVDLCLRIQARGKGIVVDPTPDIVHYESKSRGLDLTGSKYNRLYEEAGRLRSKHPLVYSRLDGYWPQFLSVSNPRATPAYLDTPDLMASDSPLAITKRIQGEHYTSIDKSSNICIYVNYSPINRIRPDILQQIKEISCHYDIIFVTTCESEMEGDALFHELTKFVSKVIFRHNIGYDFGSWKAGILDSLDLVLSADSLLLMNDSLYGPLSSLDELFERTLHSKSDVTCMTLNRVGGVHAQSYYVSYKPSVIQSPEFTAFWKSIPIYCDKFQLIKNCEMKWSHYLIETGRSFEALYDTGSFGNQTHINWKALITEHGCPFVKNELILKNPVGQDLTGIQQILGTNNALYTEMMRYWQDTNEKLAFDFSYLP